MSADIESDAVVDTESSAVVDTESAAVVDTDAGLQLSVTSDTRLGWFSADLDTLAAEVYRNRYIIVPEPVVLASVEAVEQPLVLQ